jgi:hypothetical protein
LSAEKLQLVAQRWWSSESYVRSLVSVKSGVRDGSRHDKVRWGGKEGAARSPEGQGVIAKDVVS